MLSPSNSQGFSLKLPQRTHTGGGGVPCSVNKSSYCCKILRSEGSVLGASRWTSDMLCENRVVSHHSYGGGRDEPVQDQLVVTCFFAFSEGGLLRQRHGSCARKIEVGKHLPVHRPRIAISRHSDAQGIGSPRGNAPCNIALFGRRMTDFCDLEGLVRLVLSFNQDERAFREDPFCRSLGTGVRTRSEEEAVST